MKKRVLYILLGTFLSISLLSGCSEKKTEEATEAVDESTQTEEEGTGEAEEDTESEEKAKEDSDDKDSAKDSSSSEPEEASASGDDSETAEESSEEEEVSAEQVAVLFPNEEEWAVDAEEIRSAFESDGYEPVMLYAKDDTDMQVSQIREMMTAEVSAFVIAPVDAYGLSDVLLEVKDSGIPVFSYDDLIMDTNGVKYYVTFGGRQIGQQIAQAVVEREELEKLQQEKGSKTIEFFMGSLDDSQALFLYNGMMEVLQPYLDDGTLVCSSGKTSFEDTGILRWNGKTAQSRASAILSEYYPGTAPDIIITGFDAAALGVETALINSGITADSEIWPVISGMGCEAEAVKEIASGKLTFSIFLDRRALADQCEDMVNVLLHGEDDPEVNDYEQYDNGVKIIGTYLCDPQLIDEDNYEILIDNGYYTESEVRPEATPTPVPTETPVPAEQTEETEEDIDQEEEAEVSPTPTEKPRTTLKKK